MGVPFDTTVTHLGVRRFFKCLETTAIKTQDRKVLFPHLFSGPAPAADTQTAVALRRSRLLVRLRLFVVVLTDLEVTQLVRLLVGRHHSQPVTEVVLLQVLLC